VISTLNGHIVIIKLLNVTL